MTDREKLIKLLDECIPAEFPWDTNDDIADYLLANGVIVLPCDAGETVWKIVDVFHSDGREHRGFYYEKEVVEYNVRSVSISCNSKGKRRETFRICEVINGKTIDNERNIEFDDFGKTVFLTKEEAEKVLAERSKSNDS